MSSTFGASTHKTKNTRHLDLDGWRGYSILAVIIGHFFAQSFINIGRLGVEMFFVLSGRLMAEILFVHQVDLARFFRRRISRVWPALFVLIIALWLSTYLFLPQLNISTANALSALSFSYNYMTPYFDRNANLDHIWSLCVEEHIYILLGLVAYITRRYQLSAIVIIGLITIVCIATGLYRTLFLGLDYYQVYWRSDVRGASILMSACTFLIFEKHKIFFQPYIPIIFAILGILLSISTVPDTVKYTLGSLCLAITVCTVISLPTIIKCCLTNRFITYLGLISFSLYLWQQPFYNLLGHMPKYQLLSAAFLLAIASYILIENPSRRFLNRVWAK
jgi:peptidoglycan/LPS O-acetylase OafA/YrhL